MKRQILLMLFSGLIYLVPFVSTLIYSSINPPQYYTEAVELVRQELYEMINGRVFAESLKSCEIERISLKDVPVDSLDTWWHNIYTTDNMPHDLNIIDQKQVILFKKVALQVESNSLADYLVSFQEVHPEYKEIMVTDRQGYLLAMTNITSDYIQSDEAWWKEAVSEGTIGAIEYDKSAANWVLPISFQINDKDNSFRGVIKVLIDITRLSKRRRL